MKVMVIGSGAREHALAWKLAQSPQVEAVFTAPGNPGTAALGTNLPEVKATDIHAVVAAAKDAGVELVVVGPEAPLAAGLVDALEAENVPAFGPRQAAARLEASKGFAKDFMKRFDIPTAAYGTFEDPEAAKAFVRARGEAMVVKADGLAAGKGVVVAETVEETCAAIDEMLVDARFGEAGARVVVEEKLVGPEVSFHAICDGTGYVALAAAQDHKRLLAGDEGPNTGGMGAYSPPPMVTPEIEAQIRAQVIEPTLRGMAELGCPFRGALFVGLMIVDGAPRVLEYNVRFGDPEAQVVLPRLTSDLTLLLAEAAAGSIDHEPTFTDDACVTVACASEFYPATPRLGDVIEGLAAAAGLDGVEVFFAGVESEGDDLVTSGGRVLYVTATAPTIEAARARAYEGVERITWPGMHHRSDIAADPTR